MKHKKERLIAFVLVPLLFVLSLVSGQVHGQVTTTSADALYKEGVSYYEQGNREKALELLNKALEIDPRHKDALSYKGNISRELGRFEDDFESWDRYVALDSSNAIGWFNRAFPLAMLKRYHEADDSYRHAKRLAPDDSHIMMGYGRFLMETGNYEGAKGEFERATSGTSPDPAASAFALACKIVLKQLTGVGVPTGDWHPDYHR
jgi:Tfp pilus assembly protein PilF